MAQKVIFSGPAVKSDMVVLILEKWGLHPQLEELTPSPDLDNLDRDARVRIPEDEYDQAKEILFGESEIERAGF